MSDEGPQAPVAFEKLLFGQFLSVYMKLDHQGMSSEDFSLFVGRHLAGRLGEHLNGQTIGQPYGDEFKKYILSFVEAKYPDDEARQRGALEALRTQLQALAQRPA